MWLDNPDQQKNTTKNDIYVKGIKPAGSILYIWYNTTLSIRRIKLSIEKQ